MNITLIGMPGSGKSSIGRVVAHKLGLRFVDVDTVLEERCGKPLQQTLDEVGDEEFLRLEEEAILALGNVKDTLLAPGGSIVYCARAMEFLKQHSTVVFLESPLREIAPRIRLGERGIVRGAGQTLEQIYTERLPLYRQYADAAVAVADNAAEENARRIIAALDIQ